LLSVMRADKRGRFRLYLAQQDPRAPDGAGTEVGRADATSEASR
jgi:hypothetical protein